MILRIYKPHFSHFKESPLTVMEEKREGRRKLPVMEDKKEGRRELPAMEEKREGRRELPVI